MTVTMNPRIVASLLARPLLRPLLGGRLQLAPRWMRQLSTRTSKPLIVATGTRPNVQMRVRRTGIRIYVASTRTIFIQTENTPNADALKFILNHRIVPPNICKPYVEYINLRSTISPPHPSPLASRLMNIDGVMSVFYGADFITITKEEEANWAHIRPEIFALITEAITSGETIVHEVEATEGETSAGVDSLAYNEKDDEVVGMIKELLETRIRPAIQEDGGDIDFLGFEDGYVKMKLRGACRTCDSSTATLKNGIEGMLMHYIEEVKGVHQVLDPEEEIALQEFAKFEEKLKQRTNSPSPD